MVKYRFNPVDPWCNWSLVYIWKTDFSQKEDDKKVELKKLVKYKQGVLSQNWQNNDALMFLPTKVNQNGFYTFCLLL